MTRLCHERAASCPRIPECPFVVDHYDCELKMDPERAARHARQRDIIEAEMKRSEAEAMAAGVILLPVVVFLAWGFLYSIHALSQEFGHGVNREDVTREATP